MSTIAVFPGQGSQFVGMGKDLVENFRTAREVFEEASDSIRVDLKKLCFDGPASDLTLTENTQPALLTASIAAFRVAETELGFKPAWVAGHSLGEYSALVAAGAFTLAEAAMLVRERGKAMQEAVPAGEGKMAALLGSTEDQVNELCAEATRTAIGKRRDGAPPSRVDCTVEPANYNAPGQIVISGSKDAVNEAIAAAASRKIKAIALDVSAPFHCSLMKPARERMAALFASRKSAAPTLRIPYIANRTGRLNVEVSIIASLLEEQVDHAVLWSQSMSHAIDQGASRLVECGPGNVLQGLMKRIAKDKGATIESFGIGSLEGLRASEQKLAEKPHA